MDDVEVRIGGIYKVIEANLVYQSYDEFAINAGHADIISNKDITRENFTKTQDRIVRVLYIGRHFRKTTEIIAIVETIDGIDDLKFMIDINGLEIASSSFVQEYLSNKKLNEMIPDYCIDELFIDAIVLKNPMDIQYINTTLLTDDHYKRVLCKDGGLLGLIPEERRTLELCKIATLEEPYAETFVPERFKSLVNS